MAKGMSKTAYAALYQININLVSKMIGAGVDMDDRKAVRNHVLKLKRRPKAWAGGCPWDPSKKVSDEEATQVDELSQIDDLDELVQILTKQVIGARDYDTARTLKAKVDTIKKIKDIQILANEYMKRSEVRDGVSQITVMVCNAMNRLESELPPIVHGMEPAQVAEAVADKTRSIRQGWNDAVTKLEDSGNE